jgi:hypothetical protein
VFMGVVDSLTNKRRGVDCFATGACAVLKESNGGGGCGHYDSSKNLSFI